MAVTLAEWAEWMFAGGEQWTDWLPLSETEFARVPEGEGAYVVGIKDRAKIGRLLEDDPHSGGDWEVWPSRTSRREGGQPPVQLQEGDE